MTTPDAITLTLPWPPSVNGYWRSIVRGKGPKARPTQILSERGREYRAKAAVALLEQGITAKFTGPVRVTERYYPPDLRKRDLDNLRKSPRDALSHYGVWSDDSQVVEDHGYMMAKDAANPRVEIVITRSEA
jgi:crossover junction endodeoxyribonuclease RusA